MGGPVSAQAGGTVAVTFASSATPNPAANRTNFAYAIGTDMAPAGPVQVSFTLHDAHGRLVRTLHNGPLASGQYHAEWNLSDDHGARVPAGVYFARFQAGRVTRNFSVVVLN